MGMIRVAFGFLLHLSPARTTTTTQSSIRNQSGAAWEKRQLQSSFPPACPCLPLLPLLIPPSGCRLPVPRICWHIFISFSLPSLPNSLYRARSPHNYYSVHIVAMPPLSPTAPLHPCLSPLGLSLSMNRWKRWATDLCTASGTIDLSLGGVSPTLLDWKFC